MIREAKEEDLKRIKQIANQNREHIGFVMNVALRESIKNNSLFVYEKNNIVLGFVHFHKRKDGWNTLHELVVDKQFQHQGIGQTLFNIVPTPIRLKTTLDNTNARNFYSKNGMGEVGVEQGKKRELVIYEKQPELNNKPKTKL